MILQADATRSLLHYCCTVAVLCADFSSVRLAFVFGFGSGAGIRTLNLAVNRSLNRVQMGRSKFAADR